MFSNVFFLILKGMRKPIENRKMYYPALTTLLIILTNFYV
jgi:hypothetical protein